MTNFASPELRGFVAAKHASTAPIKKPEASKSESLTMGPQARPAYSIHKRPRPMVAYDKHANERTFSTDSVARQATSTNRGQLSRVCMRLQNSTTT